jgi:hypothetical protein
VTGSITGTSGSLTVSPAAASSLTVSTSTATPSAGTAFNVTVTAKDAYANTATGYTGTVHFASTDANGVLPADYTFVPGDNGTHTFTGGVTLETAGMQTVTATDTLTGSITGTSGGLTVQSSAKDITSFTVPGQVGSSTIDTTNHAVTFHMPYGTDVSSLTPSISVSANATVSPASGTAEDFSTPVTYTVTAQDNSTRTWTAACIVDPAVTHTVIVSASPASGGTVSGGGTYNDGTQVTVAAAPNSGYNFVNWTENGTVVSTNATYIFNLGTSNRTLAANFTVIPVYIPYYNVSVSASPADGGTVSGGGTYSEWSWIAVTATPNSGCSFVNWTEGGTVVSTSATYNFTLTYGRALVANFMANYPAITTSSLSSGTVGVLYSATLAASGGIEPYTWSAAGLPAGLSISTDGVISGTPTVAGTSAVEITVADSRGNNASFSFSLAINGADSPPPDDSQYTLWPGLTGTIGVAENKVWQIEFGQELDASTLTDSSIFICRAGTGEKHPVVIGAANEPGTSGTTVTLTPVQSYVAGGSYELYLNCSIKSNGGAALAQDIRMPFTVFAPLPDNSQYTLWTGSVPAKVAEDKQWLITFNQEVDPSTLTDTSIFICKAGTGERHPVAVGFSSGSITSVTTATVNPRQPCDSEGSYVLYIDNSIKDKNGSYLAQGIQIPFSVTGAAAAGLSSAGPKLVSDAGTVSADRITIDNVIAGESAGSVSRQMELPGKAAIYDERSVLNGTADDNNYVKGATPERPG